MATLEGNKMHENIKYVRDKKIAALLNEMVLQVLASSPTDPLEELISFLEEKVRTRGSAPQEEEGSDEEGDQTLQKGARRPRKPTTTVDAVEAATPIAKEEVTVASQSVPPAPAPIKKEEIERVVKRSEALEVKKNQLLEKLSADYTTVPSAEDDLAAMLVNESLFRAAMSQLKSGRATKSIEKSNRITELVDSMFEKSDQIDFYFQQHVSGMDNMSFTQYKSLQIIENFIRNEFKFSAALKTYTSQVTDKAGEFLSSFINNSAALIKLAESVETQTFELEHITNGGCVGKGTLIYVENLSSSILRSVERYSANTNKFIGKYTAGVPKNVPKVDIEAICQDWTANENTFRTFIRDCQFKFKGNPIANELIGRAITTSEKSDSLMREVALNHIFLKEGINPKSTEEYVHHIQLTKERIDQTSKKLTAWQLGLTNRVSSHCVAVDCEAISKLANKAHKKVQEEVAAIPADTKSKDKDKDKGKDKDKSKANGQKLLLQALSINDKIQAIINQIKENDKRIITEAVL